MAASPADVGAAPGRDGPGNRWDRPGLLLVFGLELALFWFGTARHYAWIYPRWFDQSQYLGEAYARYGEVGGRGWARAAAAALAHASPQGALHSFLALGVFAVAGPSRTAALLVNLLAFAALQAATFGAVRRVAGGSALAWAAVGLLAALAGPWSGGSGSATDFRLDWMAACAYGIALAAAIRGDGFRSTGWAAAFGAAVGVVLLCRFLTAVYFMLILLGFAAWILRGPDRGPRLGRLALAAGAAAGLAGWAFWRCRRLIYDYYWVGHVGGPERSLRDAHLGPGAALGWFADQLLLHQVGLVALALAAAVAAVLWYHPGYAEAGRGGPPAVAPDAWAAAGLFFAAPALVLLLHPARASQPLAVLVAPGVWLAVLGWVQVGRRATLRGLRVSAAVAAGVGALGFSRGVLHDDLTAAQQAQYRAVNALADFLHFRSEEAGLGQPKLAVTWVYDALSAEGFRIAGLERHGRLIPYEAVLPTGLFAADPARVRADLAASDFVCLVTRAPALFPFDRQIAAMLPENRRWCDQHLRLDGTLDEEGFSARIYERGALAAPPSGGADLAGLVRSAAAGDPWVVAPPPGPPLAPEPEPILWSTTRPVRYQPTAGYGPVRFTAVAIPAELSWAPRWGQLTGLFPQPGTFRASFRATNAVGATPVQVEFRAVAADWAAEVDVPPGAEVGRPVDLHFRAFDGAGRLNFIDVTDLTAARVLVRLVPNEDQHESWSGRCAATFASPGPHRVLLRFVRYDLTAAVPYTYLDQERVVAVAAGVEPPGQAKAAAAPNPRARAVRAAQAAAGRTSEEPAAVATAPPRRNSATVASGTRPVGFTPVTLHPASTEPDGVGACRLAGRPALRLGGAPE